MQDTIVRSLLKRGIYGTASHLNTTEIFEGLEFRFTGLYASPIPNTIWQIAEHMHLWVRLKVDMFEGRSIVMPEGHGFGLQEAPESEEAWENFKKDYKASIDRIGELIETLDLEKRYPEWSNLTAAEVIGVMINHNSYHAAQVVAMRRVLGVWGK
jgi:uncharacterized damage-inducible protein DinB